MNFVALRMLTGDRAKYVGLIFAIAFSTFLLENQSSIFAGILKRTTSQILDVTDADICGTTCPRTSLFGKDTGKSLRLFKDLRTMFSPVALLFSGKLSHMPIT